MKRVPVLFSRRRVGCLSAGLLLMHAAVHAQPGIAGTWLTEDGASKVQIDSDGALVNGKLVWLKAVATAGQPLLDAHNADPALRNRALLGTLILSGFKAGAAGTWHGGSVYAPRSGKSYPADLTLLPDGRLQLKVDAGLMSKTEIWTR